MAKPAHEDFMDKRLRWMEENVNGAYNAVHPQGHDQEGGHCTNSGTCILVCCYIEALGKVIMKGQPGSKARFKEFLRVCMNDFLAESNARTDLTLPGDELLYKVFRCGFVHGYPQAGFGWGRSGPPGKYWFIEGGCLTLHIDELVAGFKRGRDEFRKCAAIDTDLRMSFSNYITAN
jgi:hypothetical protein